MMLDINPNNQSDVLPVQATSETTMATTASNSHYLEKSEAFDQVERASSDSQHDVAAIEAEKRYNRKLDVRILPYCFLLFFFSFLDRSSIGNASIAGLTKDIKLTGVTYNIALALFFLVYMLVEIPTAWVFKWMGPRYFFSASIFCFGICTVCLGFIRTPGQLYAIRCLLGFFEGGLTPCLYVYIAMYYRRYHMQRRASILYIAGPLSNAFGGLIAAGAGEIKVSHYRGWPWIFFIEGPITILVGVIVFWRLPNFPSECKFLTAQDLEYARYLSVGDGSGMQNVEKETFAWRKVKQGLVNWNTVCIALGSVSVYCNVYAYSLFSPSIIKAFGYKTINSQLLSVPPYIAGVISVLIVCQMSDRMKIRAPFALGATVVQAIGWILQLACKGVGVRYFGLFLIAIGAFSSVMPFATWIVANVHPYYPRMIATTCTTAMGTAGGIIATFSFVSLKGSRTQGSAINLGMCCWTMIMICLLFWRNRVENKARAEGKRDYRLQQGWKIPEEELGSLHPHFVLSQ